MTAAAEKIAEELTELPTRIVFTTRCKTCPGDGVVRAKRAGIDWPTPCKCQAKTTLTNYQIARMLKVSPRLIVRLAHGRASAKTSEELLRKLTDPHGPLARWSDA